LLFVYQRWKKSIGSGSSPILHLPSREKVFGQVRNKFLEKACKVLWEGDADLFSKGLYGRLDKNYVFQTTVTNVEPTAKQSRVLNPYVRRCRIMRGASPSVTLFLLLFSGPAVPPYGHCP
jgi:hypothetical protein